MSFNPLMGLLTQAVLPICTPAPSIMEFGNQSLTIDDKTLELICTRAPDYAQDDDGLRAIGMQPGNARKASTAAFYRCLGAASYAAIDVNDLYGSLIMDLNRNLAEHYGYTGQFDLVTNNGTGEHIFDQHAVFENMHALTHTGGIMVHVMPFVNYINHGFFSFHPNLYHALAAANRYDILTLGIATRDGHGLLARPSHVSDTAAATPANFLARGKEVALSVLLADPKVPRRNFGRGTLEAIASRFPSRNSKRVFGSAIHRLLLHHRKLLVFAVLRKTAAAAFATPIQLRYSDDVAPELTFPAAAPTEAS